MLPDEKPAESSAPEQDTQQAQEEGQQAAAQAEQERLQSDLENLTGQYHGLTRQQADLIEAARGDPTKGTDGIIESANEPPGSDPFPEEAQQTEQSAEQQSTEQQPAEPQPAAEEDELDELPSDAELNAMTRAELDELAVERGLDPSTCSNKAAVIEMLKDAEEE
jgi:hypothetical protein